MLYQCSVCLQQVTLMISNTVPVFSVFTAGRTDDFQTVPVFGVFTAGRTDDFQYSIPVFGVFTAGRT